MMFSKIFINGQKYSVLREFLDRDGEVSLELIEIYEKEDWEPGEPDEIYGEKLILKKRDVE